MKYADLKTDLDLAIHNLAESMRQMLFYLARVLYDFGLYVQSVDHSMISYDGEWRGCRSFYSRRFDREHTR